MDSLDILLLPSTLISIIVWAIDRDEMKKKIKLILIMYENEVQPKCHNKPLKKDTMTDLESENIKIDNIIKSLLNKINKN